VLSGGRSCHTSEALSWTLGRTPSVRVDTLTLKGSSSATSRDATSSVSRPLIASRIRAQSDAALQKGPTLSCKIVSTYEQLRMGHGLCCTESRWHVGYCCKVRALYAWTRITYQGVHKCHDSRPAYETKAWSHARCPHSLSRGHQAALCLRTQLQTRGQLDINTRGTIPLSSWVTCLEKATSRFSARSSR